MVRRYKSWKMTLLLPIGSLLYVVGLITREAGSYVWPATVGDI